MPISVAHIGCNLHRSNSNDQVGSGSAAQPSSRYFKFAADAFRSKHIVNRTAQLVGNEIADHGRAVSGGFWRNYPRAASLSPFEHEFATRGTARRPSPAYHNPAVVIGQSPVLGGIGGELM